LKLRGGKDRISKRSLYLKTEKGKKGRIFMRIQRGQGKKGEANVVIHPWGGRKKKKLGRARVAKGGGEKSHTW